MLHPGFAAKLHSMNSNFSGRFSLGEKRFKVATHKIVFASTKCSSPGWFYIVNRVSAISLYLTYLHVL